MECPDNANRAANGLDFERLRSLLQKIDISGDEKRLGGGEKRLGGGEKRLGGGETQPKREQLGREIAELARDIALSKTTPLRIEKRDNVLVVSGSLVDAQKARDMVQSVGDFELLDLRGLAFCRPAALLALLPQNVVKFK